MARGLHSPELTERGGDCSHLSVFLESWGAGGSLQGPPGKGSATYSVSYHFPLKCQVEKLVRFFDTEHSAGPWCWEAAPLPRAALC